MTEIEPAVAGGVDEVRGAQVFLCSVKEMKVQSLQNASF